MKMKKEDNGKRYVITVFILCIFAIYLLGQ
jgi:hypothetical protein